VHLWLFELLLRIRDEVDRVAMLRCGFEAVRRRKQLVLFRRRFDVDRRQVLPERHRYVCIGKRIELLGRGQNVDRCALLREVERRRFAAVPEGTEGRSVPDRDDSARKLPIRGPRWSSPLF
jgi:hypothetical protein